MNYATKLGPEATGFKKKVMLRRLVLMVCASTLLILSNVVAEQLELELAWALAPGSRPYLTSGGSLQPSMAYNPKTGHLLLVDLSDYRLNYPNALVGIHIIDSRDGADLGTMDTYSTDFGLPWPIHYISVADDGSIYATGDLGMDTDRNPQRYIYRWENEESPQTIVFYSDPADGDRQAGNGTTFVARGSGAATEIWMCSRDGKNIVIFRPDSDGLLTPQKVDLDQSIISGGDNGMSGFAFSGNDTFWLSGVYTLAQYEFDLGSGAAHLLQAFKTGPTHFGLRLILGSDQRRGVFAAMPSSDRPVSLFAITERTNVPVFLDIKPFPSSYFSTGGSLQFSNNRLFVLQTDNGIAAYDVKSVPDGPPVIVSPPESYAAPGPGIDVTFNVLAKGTLPRAYQWYHNNDLIRGAGQPFLILTNISLEALGQYRVSISNIFGETNAVADLSFPSLMPKLAVTLVGPKVVVSWPLAAEGFFLESTLELGPRASWSKVEVVPSVASGNTLTINIDPSESSRFFRLRK
jgi:hypothetical protein